MIKFNIGDIVETVESYGPNEWYMGRRGQRIRNVTIGKVVSVHDGIYPQIKIKIISGHLFDSKTYNYDHVYVLTNDSMNETVRLIEKCKKTKKQ